MYIPVLLWPADVLFHFTDQEVRLCILDLPGLLSRKFRWTIAVQGGRFAWLCSWVRSSGNNLCPFGGSGACVSIPLDVGEQAKRQSRYPRGLRACL
jgi:hypothetical protein